MQARDGPHLFFTNPIGPSKFVLFRALRGGFDHVPLSAAKVASPPPEVPDDLTPKGKWKSHVKLKEFGAWLSLVERLVRDQEAGGSNPLAPTIPPFNSHWIAAIEGVRRSDVVSTLCPEFRDKLKISFSN